MSSPTAATATTTTTTTATPTLPRMLSSKYWKAFASSPGWGPRGIASQGLEAYTLGVVGGLAFALIFALPSFRPFFVYLFMLSIFHVTEWMFAAVYHTYACTTESFLIPHSRAYSVAMFGSMVEYWLEWLIFGALYEPTIFFWFGVSLCVAGQVLRWVAFVHAGHSFTHLIEETKSEKHVLVTDGVYKFIRHPGYAGWFYWSIGTQMTLGNPVCVVAFTLASWRFFKVRILYEEELLESEDFFGKDYTRYRDKTPTFIPFIQ